MGRSLALCQLYDFHQDWTGGEAMPHDGRPTRGLALPEAVLPKIFRENALRWFPGLRA